MDLSTVALAQVDPRRLELLISSLQMKRCNQLSYGPPRHAEVKRRRLSFQSALNAKKIPLARELKFGRKSTCVLVNFYSLFPFRIEALASSAPIVSKLYFDFKGENRQIPYLIRYFTLVYKISYLFYLIS